MNCLRGLWAASMGTSFNDWTQASTNRIQLLEPCTWPDGGGAERVLVGCTDGGHPIGTLPLGLRHTHNVFSIFKHFFSLFFIALFTSVFGALFYFVTVFLLLGSPPEKKCHTQNELCPQKTPQRPKRSVCSLINPFHTFWIWWEYWHNFCTKILMKCANNPPPVHVNGVIMILFTCTRKQSVQTFVHAVE